MLHLETIPLSESPFADIVDNTAWTIDTRNMAVAKDLNFLVTTPPQGYGNYNLIFFSEVEIDEEVVKIPSSVEEVRERIGKSPLGMINRDWTAKGLGFTGANSPLAIHHPDKAMMVAARIIPLLPGIEIKYHEENNSKLALRGQWMRHAGLIVRAAIGDALSNDYAGTRSAMERMEQDYGDAQIIVRNAPPTWQAKQAKLGIEGEIPARKILVRHSTNEHRLEHVSAVGSVWPTDLLP